MKYESAIIRRFLKGFVAGGIGSAAALLAVGITVSSLDDLKKFGVSLATAFLAGGLLAVEKMLSWKDEPQA